MQSGSIRSHVGIGICSSLYFVLAGCGQALPNRSLSASDVNGSLAVYQLTVSDHNLGGATVGRAQFSITHDANYAEVLVCPNATANCDTVQKVATNLFTLKAMPEGDVTVKVRACAEDTVSGQSACGSWRTAVYNQRDIDPRIKALIIKRELASEDLKELALQVKSALEKYQIEALDCLTNEKDKKKVAAIRSGISLFLKLGESLLLKSFDPKAVKENLEEKILSQLNPLDLINSIGNFKQELSSVEGIFGTLEELGKSIGLLENSQTISGISVLGSALLDLFLPAAQSSSNCTAQKVAEARIGALKQMIDWKQNEISKIDAELE